ncbi:MAG: TonB-dependent receptor, partial [Sphingopyxis sp.]
MTMPIAIIPLLVASASATAVPNAAATATAAATHAPPGESDEPGGAGTGTRAGTGTGTSTGTLGGDAADGAIVVIGLPQPVGADGYGTRRVDGRQLAMGGSARLEDGLARIPGFQQFRRSDGRSANPSAQGITLRGVGGNAASRTLLLLDGVPQADACFGAIPFTALPVDMVAAASITRGSGTGAFGAGAVAGVVDLLSVPLAQRPAFSAQAALGSRQSAQAALGAAAALGGGYIAIDLHREQGDGFYTSPTSQRAVASVPARYRATSATITAQAPLAGGGAVTARIAAYQDQRTL